MTDRERFEAWYAKGYDEYVPNFTDGEYTQDHAQSLWQAWKARCPEGWQCVPVEPTTEMVDAASEAYMPFGDMALAIQAAIAYAPEDDQ